MSFLKSIEMKVMEARSHSVQGLTSNVTSPAMKIPLPPRLWITGLFYYATNICVTSIKRIASAILVLLL